MKGWENFYVIVGSAAGALIGLQFVVLTLVATRPLSRTDPQVGQAFTSPTVVHFTMVLLLSALNCAPWNGMGTICVIWAVIALGGAGVVLRAAARMRGQTTYEVVLEDWVFHLVIPLAAYALLLTGCATHGPFYVAAATLALLFCGIHNAWDIITFHVFQKIRDDKSASEGAAKE